MKTAMIVIDIGQEVRRFERAEDAVMFIRALGNDLKSRVEATRDQRVKLGIALNAVRPSVAHGQWEAYVDRCGLHKRTAERCMRIAAFAGPDGTIDMARVPAAVAGKGLVTYTDLLSIRRDGSEGKKDRMSLLKTGVGTRASEHEVKSDRMSLLKTGVGTRATRPGASLDDLFAGGEPGSVKPASHAGLPPGAIPGDGTIFVPDDGDADYGDDDAWDGGDWSDEEDEDADPAEVLVPDARRAPDGASRGLAPAPGRAVQLGLDEVYALAEDTRKLQDEMLGDDACREAAIDAMRRYHGELEIIRNSQRKGGA
ncbi:MAG: hypothetical protein WAZ94_13285 [Phycisphaerales bacterium]